MYESVGDSLCNLFSGESIMRTSRPRRMVSSTEKTIIIAQVPTWFDVVLSPHFQSEVGTLRHPSPLQSLLEAFQPDRCAQNGGVLWPAISCRVVAVQA